jgi:hypothetical protein
VSSYYGVIFPEFWTGPTGREIRLRGGRDAQLLGLYLATNRHANMLGLYQLMVDDVRHETGLSLKAIERGYQVTTEADFATFDAVTGFVWVRQMARFRLGLVNGEGLAVEDKRVQAINRIYHALPVNPFLGVFYEVNRKLLCLKKKREAPQDIVPFQVDHYLSPLRRGLQGATKGLLSQITDLQITDVQGSEIRSAASRDQITPPTPLSAKGGRLTRKQLKAAEMIRNRVHGGCPHTPRCDTAEACIRHIAAANRGNGHES